MTTKYRTQRYSPALIKAVEVERETDQSVWIAGRRNAKQSQYENYYDSWSEARAALLETAEAKVMAARRALDLANATLGNVKGMKQAEAAPINTRTAP